MIRQIEVHPYKELFGGNTTEHNAISILINESIRENLPDLKMDLIDVYNLCGDKHTHYVGKKEQRLLIFINATNQDADEAMTLDKPATINGIENNIKKFLAPAGNSDALIVSEEGIPLAEWFDETHHLNILFDVFSEYEESSIYIFESIMKEFNRLVWHIKKLENSWLHSHNKKELTKRFTEQIKTKKERKIKEDRDYVIRVRNDIINYQRSLKGLHDKLLQGMRSIETEEKNVTDITKSLIDDLNLIVKHEKIKDLQIMGDDKFHIYTHPLYITSSHGKRYYGGEYEIVLNLENSGVLFFGNNPRRAYWSEKDSHPHVDGSNGNPCLGNAADAIAELSAQMQLYAVVMICIDFLESANENDPAGEKIVRWDEVDTLGRIIKYGNPDEGEEEEEEVVCPDCNETYYISDTLIAFADQDEDGTPLEARRVCPECRDTHYICDEEYSGEYIDRERMRQHV